MVGPYFLRNRLRHHPENLNFPARNFYKFRIALLQKSAMETGRTALPPSLYGHGSCCPDKFPLHQQHNLDHNTRIQPA
mgnify:CR=1 FL=1